MTWRASRVVFHHELDEGRSGPLFLELSESAKFRLYTLLGQERLQLVALLHTHPKEWVGLSDIDADNQICPRIGFWSIVVPWYGREPWDVCRLGVHVRLDQGWRHLPEEEAERRLVIES